MSEDEFVADGDLRLEGTTRERIQAEVREFYAEALERRGFLGRLLLRYRMACVINRRLETELPSSEAAYGTSSS